MKILCTFSGKFGDILWSLPTVEAIAMQNSGNGGYSTDNDSEVTELHFGIMPQYESLLPLLNAQDYISKAFVIENWICTGSPHGDQPWEAPVPEGYDKVYHLAYRNHPGGNDPLISFIARQQGITLSNPIPFINLPSGIVGDTEENSKLIRLIEMLRYRPHVAVAFNESMADVKDQFLKETINRFAGVITFIDISKMPWLTAAWVIDNCIAFLGCRSSNYVLACGLGKKVFVYEPNTARSKFGMWGTTFTCPYADETEINYTSIYQMVDYVKSKIVEVVK